MKNAFCSECAAESSSEGGLAGELEACLAPRVSTLAPRGRKRGSNMVTNSETVTRQQTKNTALIYEYIHVSEHGADRAGHR